MILLGFVTASEPDMRAIIDDRVLWHPPDTALGVGSAPPPGVANEARSEKPKAPLRDAALQRAVDFITTIAIYEKKPAAKK